MFSCHVANKHFEHTDGRADGRTDIQTDINKTHSHLNVDIYVECNNILSF